MLSCLTVSFGFKVITGQVHLRVNIIKGSFIKKVTFIEWAYKGGVIVNDFNDKICRYRTNCIRAIASD